MDVGEDSSLGDDDLAEESVELLVVSDRELQVSGNDSRFLVVSRRVSGQLEDLRREVSALTSAAVLCADGARRNSLENGREVDGRTGSDSLGVVSLSQKSVDTSDRELESGLARSGHALLVRRVSARLSS